MIYKATGNPTVISSSRAFAAFPIDCVTLDDIARLISNNNFQHFLNAQVRHFSDPDVHNRSYGRYPLLVRAVALQFHMFNFTGFSDQCGTLLKWQWTDGNAARRTCIDYAIGYGS